MVRAGHFVWWGTSKVLGPSNISSFTVFQLKVCFIGMQVSLFIHIFLMASQNGF